MTPALRRLEPYLAPVRGSLVVGLLTVVASTVLAVASPWLLKFVVDGLLQGIESSQLTMYALLIVAAAALDGWIRIRMRQMFFGVSRRVECEVRRDLLAHLAKLPASYHQSSRTGALMSHMSNDVSAVRTMLAQGVMNFANYTLGLIIPLGAMLWLDARLTAVALLPFPVAWLAARRINRAVQTHFRQRQAQATEVSAVLHEGLTGMKLLKACRREAADFARFSLANDAYAASSDRLIAAQAASVATLRFSFFFSTVLALWFGGSEVIAGRLTLGELVVFSRYQMLLGWPITGFGWAMNILQGGMIAWRRILELLDVPADAGMRHATPEVSPVLGRRVEARHLSFRYADDGEKVLDDVSFMVSAGEMLAIVGATGSGKSTLANLLCRLRPVTEGALLIDGIDVGLLPLPSVRRAVRIATQQPFIFGDTIGANIAFGLSADAAPAAIQAMVERAADLAHLAGDISELPDGYDTMVGERGATLSGGQQQRLAVARALMANAPILVLDDALSKVDSDTEARILAHLRAVGRSRICIIVAHRVSTVRGADQILVLDRGRIVERGSHAELLVLGGLYADMHRRQSIEQELSDL